MMLINACGLTGRSIGRGPLALAAEWRNLRLPKILLAISLSAGNVSLGIANAADAKSTLPQVTIGGALPIPELPRKDELLFTDLSKCLGASWEAPKLVREMNDLYGVLNQHSLDLRNRSTALSADRSELDREGRALSDAIEKLRLDDVVINSIRQAIDSTKGRTVATKAELDALNARIATVNEKIGQRNKYAEALRVRSNEGQSKAADFNDRVDAFNKLVDRFGSASAEYESKTKSLRIDLTRLEASCSGKRQLVKE
jgi:peptidoglycan hydrolase CwlO-like protein